MRRTATIMALLAAGMGTLTAPAQATTHRPSTPTHTRTGATATKSRAARAGQAGFRIVGTLRNPVVAMTSPAQGAVWLAERAKDGSLVVAEVGGPRWTAQTLPVTLDPYGHAKVKLSGTAANDLWLTAVGQLWHYDGTRWSRTALPAGATATTVQDLKGSAAYVGLVGDNNTTGVFRYNRGRWTSLGRPTDPYGDRGHITTPVDLTMVDGQLLGLWDSQAPTSMQFVDSYAYTNGAWKSVYQAYENGHGTYNKIAAWLAPDAQHQIVLMSTNNTSDDAPPVYGHCTQWVAGKVTGCTTQWAAGGAALLRDGRIVVGGSDYQRYEKPVVQGTFGIRTKDGVEKLLGGDPGDRTLGMAVEPGTNTAWAATLRGNEVLLQKWVG